MYVYTCLTLFTVTYISLCYCVTGCGGAQTCAECMKRTAQTNFSCEWCTKTEKLVYCYVTPFSTLQHMQHILYCKSKRITNW